MVFALVGDSTTTMFFAIRILGVRGEGSCANPCRDRACSAGFGAMSTRKPPTCANNAGGRGYHSRALDSFIRSFAQHGYLAVFALMLLESACIPIPSEVTMLFAGFLASPQHPAGAVQLSFVAVGLAGVAGNLVGSWAAYGVGRQ